MEDPVRSDETLKELLQSSVRSTGFWSAVAAVVGIGALILGGILYPAIDEVRDFSVALLIIGAVLLFSALVISPRIVASFLIGRQGRFGANVVVMTVAFFAIVVLINFLVDRNTSRFDFTATRIFSLAPQTNQVLDNLSSKVRANVFFVPGRNTLARQNAEDLLDELTSQTDNLTYRFIDPELNRTLALQYDVTQFPSIVFEDLNLGTRQSVVCFSPRGSVRCANFTEQEFVTGILVATRTEQKAVYVLIGKGGPNVTRDAITGEVAAEGFDYAVEGMQRDNYIVRPLDLTDFGRVPEDAAVLIIPGPNQDLDISEQVDERAALVDYIKRGGRIAALFDTDTPQSFVDLLGQWGVILGGDSIADAASSVAGQMLTPLVQRANGQFVPDVTGIGIVDQIDVTFFPEATSLELVLPREDIPPFIRYIPLAITTPASWLESDAENINPDPDEKRGPFNVVSVLQVTGTLDETERHPEAKFVIFGDSDFAKNKFFFSKDNADLLLNSVNWLAEDFELISIRPKITPVRELVLNKREADFIKWSSWFLPPSLMILLGTIVWWRRR